MMKMESSGGVGDADRISGLPESVLHQIFSSIDMKQVVQTSILSKRWKDFWKSAPDLCFTVSLWVQTNKRRRQSSHKVYAKDQTMNFVERVLLHRYNSSSIRKLHLFCINYLTDSAGVEIESSAHYRILTWLVFACIRHTEEIHLKNCFTLSYSPTELPAQIFTTVKVLELHSCGSIQLPTSLSSSPYLRILKLVTLTLHFPQANSNGEFVLSCPSLENLVLNHCHVKNLKILKISAHQLNKLVIEYWDSSCEIKISTPNLTFLKLWSSSYQNYCLRNLSSLVSCRIGGFDTHAGPSCSLQSMMKILNGVTNVSTLEIYDYSCRKDTLPSEGVYDELLNPFPNLTHLRIELSTAFSIHATVNLLRSSPSIKTLVWDANKKYLCCQREREYWREWLSFQYTFHGLEYVKAQNLQGTDNELKFLEFLLKNAKALKDVKITLVEWITMDEKLKEFMKKLHSLPKASPRVEIFFSLNFKD